MKTSKLYNPKLLETRWTQWQLCRLTGISFNHLINRKICPDQCGIRPERWITTGTPPMKICKQCGRFIGYVKESKKPKAKKARK